MNGMPSSFLATTLRGKFLNGSSLLPPSSFTRGTLLLSNPTTSSVRPTGVFVSLSGSCIGSGCAGLATTLRPLVNASVEGRCNVLSAEPSFLRSTITTDYLISNNVVMLRSMRTTTQALYRCTNGDSATFIGVSLSSSVFSEVMWPLLPFTTDATAAIGMMQNMPLEGQGFVWGSVVDGEGMHTLARMDIFSANGGGNLAKDQPLALSTNATNSIHSLFGLFSTLLESSVPSLDRAVGAVFPSNVSALLRAYQSVAPTPSVLDFLQWFATIAHEQVDIFISSDKTVLVVDVRVMGALTSGSANITSSSSLQQINSSIATIAELVKESYPSAINYASPLLEDSTFSGSQTVRLTSSLLITELATMSSNWTVSLGPTTVHEVTSISIIPTASDPLFPSISAIFEHESVDIEASVNADLQSIIGPTVGLTDDNFLLLNITGPTSTEIVFAFSSLADGLSSLNSSSNLYITYDAAVMCGETLWYSAMVGCSQLDFSDSPTVFEFRQTVAQYLESLCANTNTSIVVTLQAPTGSSFAISVVTTTTQDVSLINDGNPWAQITDTSRLVIPVVVRTSMELLVGPSWTVTFDITGETEVTGWTLPFTYNMLLGSATGVMRIVLDLPNHLSVSSNMTISSTFGERALSSILITVDSDDQQVKFGVDTNSSLQIPPTFVVHSIADGLFSLLPNAMQKGGPADIMVGSVFQTTFASQNTFSQATAAVTPWLSIPTDPLPLLTQSLPACVSNALETIFLNVSVNQMAPVECMYHLTCPPLPLSLFSPLKTQL